MTQPTCLVCGEPMKVAGKKKPYLGCPNGCTQTMVRKNVPQFEQKYGTDWRKGSSAAPTPAAAGAPKAAKPATDSEEAPRAATLKTLDEEFSS